MDEQRLPFPVHGTRQDMDSPPDGSGEAARLLYFTNLIAGTAGVPVFSLQRQTPWGGVSTSVHGPLAFKRVQGSPAPVQEDEEQPPPNLFLSLGRIGAQRAVAGLTGYKLRGNFYGYGVLDGDGGLSPGASEVSVTNANIPAHLFPFAEGWGATQTLVASGGVVGADGNYITRTIAVDKTRDGENFEPSFEYQVWTHLATIDGYPAWVPICPPTVLADGTQIMAGFGFVGPRGDNTSEFFYLHGRGGSIVAVRPVPAPLPDTPGYKRAFIPYVTSPAGRVGFVYTQSTPSTPPGVGANYSGLVVVFSEDAGQTWSEPVYPAALFEVGPREGGSPGDMANVLPGFVVPISPTRSIACVAALVGPMSNPTPSVRIKLVEIDSAARTFTSKAVLMEGPPLGYHDIIGTAIPIAGGVLFTLRTPWRTGRPLLPQPYNLAVECWFTTNGDDPTRVGTMPWPAGHTGPLFAIDKDTVGCAAYTAADGYSVYASKDLGATWERWASIALGGIDADPLEPRLMDFERVLQLPANPMPGAPWICDARVPAPT